MTELINKRNRGISGQSEDMEKNPILMKQNLSAVDMSRDIVAGEEESDDDDVTFGSSYESEDDERDLDDT